MECRFGPYSDDDQRWDRFELRVKPGGAIRCYIDGFGNTGYLVTLVGGHEAIELTSRSEVATLLADPFATPPLAPNPLTQQEQFDFLSPSRLVPADPRLTEMAEPFRPAHPEEAMAAAGALSDMVYSELQYQQNTTTTGTTVSEVLDGRVGVCQDFAHVLIGLCRAVGLPARYVSGYVTPRQGAKTKGATASHAWAEVYTPTHGWRGFDSANRLVVADNYVKVGVGRDYSDVPPTRGTFRGGAAQTLTVDVEIKPRE